MKIKRKKEICVGYSLIQIYKGNFSTLWEISLQILYGFYLIFEFIISDDADAFKDKIDWLKTNIDPPEKVKQFWRDTSKNSSGCVAGRTAKVRTEFSGFCSW